MKRTKKCKRCGVNPVVINFCNDCAKIITHSHDTVMARAAAARCYLNTRNGADSLHNKQVEIAAFLSIFYPEMNPDKANQLAHSIGRP